MTDDGKIAIPTTSAEIAQDWLDDVELEARSLGIAAPPVQKGTDWWLAAQANSKLALIAFAIVKQNAADASVVDASGAALDRLRQAYGLDEVQPKAATGKVKVECSGSRTIIDGEPMTGANNVRYQVNGTWVAITDGSEIDVVAVDKGTGGNLAGGETITFDNPPLGVTADTEVSYSVPLTGGTDSETDEEKRDRILTRLRDTPAGGNPGHVIEIANATVANLSGVYVYPALGGPGSAKVVPVKAIDPDNNSFTRVLDSSALALVRNAVQAELPTQSEIVVQAAADESVNMTLAVDIPDSVLEGGDGTGWLDSTPWPPLVAGSGAGYDYCSVTSVTSTTVIVVNSQDATGPTAGQTQVAWWAPGDQTFRIYLVTAVSGSTGSWTLTLDRPLVDSDNNSVAAGDYICPAATNTVAYGETWRTVMGDLGPGENTIDVSRVPRASRYPKVEDDAQSDLNTQLIVKLINAHPEIRVAEYEYRSRTGATIPASVDTAPNVLTLNHFGIYPEL